MGLPLTVSVIVMTSHADALNSLLNVLDEEGRAGIELTVDEILADIDAQNGADIEATARVFEDRARTMGDKEQAAVGLLLAAALRERALRQASGLH